MCFDPLFGHHNHVDEGGDVGDVYLAVAVDVAVSRQLGTRADQTDHADDIGNHDLAVAVHVTGARSGT